MTTHRDRLLAIATDALAGRIDNINVRRDGSLALLNAGKDMIWTLRSHNLLLDVPIILVTDHRNDGAVAVADSLRAVYLHERRDSFETLVPEVYAILLKD